MQQQYQQYVVESRNYDRSVRGSWRACQVDERDIRTAWDRDEYNVYEDEERPVCLWLPAGTLMNWSNGSRPLRNNCLQFFWPQRWYMLSAFYKDRTLLRTYANIIQPATLIPGRVSYVELDLSILVEPNMFYEVLTQAEFEQAADQLRYTEETRISALMALDTLTSTVQRSIGIFTVVPHQLSRVDFHLAHCS